MLHRKHEPAEADSKERADYDKEVADMASHDNWQSYRRHAGIETYLLAGIVFILPKVGALKLVAVKGPTEQTEEEYLHSVVTSTTAFRRYLVRFTVPATIAGASTARARNQRHPLPNRDLDTGKVVQPGGYPLTDSTYAKLLHQLTVDPKQQIPPGIKEDVQIYYANPRCRSRPRTIRMHGSKSRLIWQHLPEWQRAPSPNPTPLTEMKCRTANRRSRIDSERLFQVSGARQPRVTERIIKLWTLSIVFPLKSFRLFSNSTMVTFS